MFINNIITAPSCRYLPLRHALRSPRRDLYRRERRPSELTFQVGQNFARGQLRAADEQGFAIIRHGFARQLRYLFCT
jgi:hypothetical protein